MRRRRMRAGAAAAKTAGMEPQEQSAAANLARPPHLSVLAILKRLTPTARMLIACRMARSLGQGALIVDFALYLHALNWSATQMGAVYMGGLLLGAALTLAAGGLSDRIGRKPFLIGYGVAQMMAALIALITTQPVLLVIAAVTGAFGRGANGAAGPFGPVEQAWLSETLEEKEFGPFYSFNTAIGYGGMATGALLAATPALWRAELPGALAFRPLFLLTLFGAALTLVLLPRMTDARKATQARQKERARGTATMSWGKEFGMLYRLMGINALNGLAAGMIGPFMAYWFHLRYGAGPAAIGPVIALGFILASVASVWTAWLTRRLGVARAVVVTRLAGVTLFALLPFAPSYGLAAACYVLRAAFNRGSAGARQAVGLRLVGPARRGLAASLNAASMQIPRAIGPVIGGILLDTGLLALPMLIAAALQAVYLTLYGITFRSLD